MRRGQGSIEFLMTYGWAVLALLMAMDVMWQWGVFSFAQDIDPGTFGFWGITVLNGNEFIMDPAGNMQIIVLNQVGANVTILYVNLSVGSDSVACDPWNEGDICSFVPNVADESNPGAESYTIPPGKTRRIVISDNTNWIGQPGEKFEAQLHIQYNDSRTEDNVYQSGGRIWGSREMV